MKRPRFDRISRYRLAAILLLAPILAYNDLAPLGVVRMIYWAGIVMIIVNLLAETWYIYQGRRDVKRMIAARQAEDST